MREPVFRFPCTFSTSSLNIYHRCRNPSQHLYSPNREGEKVHLKGERRFHRLLTYCDEVREKVKKFFVLSTIIKEITVEFLRDKWKVV